jgi:hypothetical protein
MASNSNIDETVHRLSQILGSKEMNDKEALQFIVIFVINELFKYTIVNENKVSIE